MTGPRILEAALHLLEGRAGRADAGAARRKPGRVDLLQVARHQPVDEQHQPEARAEHAGDVEADLAGGDDRDVDDAADLAMERIGERAHRKAVVAVLRGLQRGLRPLQRVHLEQEAVGDVVARMVGRVGLAMHAVQVDLRVRPLDPVDMVAHALRIGGQVLEHGQTLMPDAHRVRSLPVKLWQNGRLLPSYSIVKRISADPGPDTRPAGVPCQRGGRIRAMRQTAAHGSARRAVRDSKLVNSQGLGYIRGVQVAVDIVEAARAGRRRG